ncbi:MAG: hypothetical protein JWN03_1888 [Nocardia sp.]|nr:hypothetical protein [Nocardia sp.]
MAGSENIPYYALMGESRHPMDAERQLVSLG